MVDLKKKKKNVKICFWAICPYSDRTVKIWTGNEMERRGGEWDLEVTAGRIRIVGVQARIWLGLLLAPHIPPLKVDDCDNRQIRRMS